MPIFGKKPPDTSNELKNAVIVNRHKVTIEKVIGQGGFADVYLVKSNSGGGGRFALKRYFVNDKDALDATRREIYIVKNLDHQNIIKYVDSSVKEHEDGIFECLLLTKYYKDSVLALIKARSAKRAWLSESEVMAVFCDMCEAVARLHHAQTPVIHRDLKIENILIDGSTYVLCDFGSATNKKFSSVTHSVSDIEANLDKFTTMAYRSPEMINLYSGIPITTKSDIWALGVLLYKLCYFSLPFGEDNKLAIINGSYSIPATPQFSSYIPALISYLLQTDPELRPDIYQVASVACEISGRRLSMGNLNRSVSLRASELVAKAPNFGSHSKSNRQHSDAPLKTQPSESSNILDSGVLSSAAKPLSHHSAPTASFTNSIPNPAILPIASSTLEDSSALGGPCLTITPRARPRPAPLAGAPVLLLSPDEKVISPWKQTKHGHPSTSSQDPPEQRFIPPRMPSLDGGGESEPGGAGDCQPRSSANSGEMLSAREQGAQYASAVVTASSSMQNLGAYKSFTLPPDLSSVKFQEYFGEFGEDDNNFRSSSSQSSSSATSSTRVTLGSATSTEKTSSMSKTNVTARDRAASATVRGSKPSVDPAAVAGASLDNKTLDSSNSRQPTEAAAFCATDAVVSTMFPKTVSSLDDSSYENNDPQCLLRRHPHGGVPHHMAHRRNVSDTTTIIKQFNRPSAFRPYRNPSGGDVSGLPKLPQFVENIALKDRGAQVAGFQSAEGTIHLMQSGQPSQTGFAKEADTNFVTDNASSKSSDSQFSSWNPFNTAVSSQPGGPDGTRQRDARDIDDDPFFSHFDRLPRKGSTSSTSNVKSRESLIMTVPVEDPVPPESIAADPFGSAPFKLAASNCRSGSSAGLGKAAPGNADVVIKRSSSGKVNARKSLFETSSELPSKKESEPSVVRISIEERRAASKISKAPPGRDVKGYIQLVNDSGVATLAPSRVGKEDLDSIGSCSDLQRDLQSILSEESEEMSEVDDEDSRKDASKPSPEGADEEGTGVLAYQSLLSDPDGLDMIDSEGEVEPLEGLLKSASSQDSSRPFVDSDSLNSSSGTGTLIVSPNNSRSNTAFESILTDTRLSTPVAPVQSSVGGINLGMPTVDGGAMLFLDAAEEASGDCALSPQSLSFDDVFSAAPLKMAARRKSPSIADNKAVTASSSLFNKSVENGHRPNSSASAMRDIGLPLFGNNDIAINSDSVPLSSNLHMPHPVLGQISASQHNLEYSNSVDGNNSYLLKSVNSSMPIEGSDKDHSATERLITPRLESLDEPQGLGDEGTTSTSFFIDSIHPRFDAMTINVGGGRPSRESNGQRAANDHLSAGITLHSSTTADHPSKSRSHISGPPPALPPKPSSFLSSATFTENSNSFSNSFSGISGHLTQILAERSKTSWDASNSAVFGAQNNSRSIANDSGLSCDPLSPFGTDHLPSPPPPPLYPPTDATTNHSVTSSDPAKGCFVNVYNPPPRSPPVATLIQLGEISPIEDLKSKPNLTSASVRLGGEITDGMPSKNRYFPTDDSRFGKSFAANVKQTATEENDLQHSTVAASSGIDFHPPKPASTISANSDAKWSVGGQFRNSLVGSPARDGSPVIILSDDDDDFDNSLYDECEEVRLAPSGTDEVRTSSRASKSSRLGGLTASVGGGSMGRDKDKRKGKHKESGVVKVSSRGDVGSSAEALPVAGKHVKSGGGELSFAEAGGGSSVGSLGSSSRSSQSRLSGKLLRKSRAGDQHLELVNRHDADNHDNAAFVNTSFQNEDLEGVVSGQMPPGFNRKPVGTVVDQYF